MTRITDRHKEAWKTGKTGKMGRWEDGKMGRWEDGKMGE